LVISCNKVIFRGALESEFQKESRDVVTTTVNDIQSQINKDLKKSIQKNLRELQSEIKTLDSLTIKSWKRIFIAGLAVFLGLFIGSWGADYISIEQNKRSIDQNRRQQKKVEKTRRNGNGDSQRQQRESLSNYTETPQVKGIERLRRQKDIYNRTGVNNENVQIKRIRGIIRRRSFSDILVLKSVCDGLKDTSKNTSFPICRL